MDNDLSLPPASALAHTPPHKLQAKTVENAKRIGYLKQLIRAEKSERDRLLANQSAHNKRPRSTNTSLSLPNSTASRPIAPRSNRPTASSTATFLDPTGSSKHPDPQHFSPRGIMDSFSGPVTSSDSSADRPSSLSPQAEGVKQNNQDTTPQRPEMAARGSHWSFIEKARFEAAALKYGPFAWDDIIRAVGTRTEKQVKAYAARYRRRKKLAARMQALPVMTYPELTKQPNSSLKPPTLPSFEHAVLSAARVRRQSAVATPSAPHQYRPAHFAGQWGRSSTAGPVVDAQVRRTSKPSEVWTEPFSSGRGQSQSSLPTSVASHEFAPTLFVQEDGSVRGDLLRSEFSGKCESLVTTESSANIPKQEIICDVLLEAANERNPQLYGMPSDIDLLVDQAIGGSEVTKGNVEKPLVTQLDEDAYAQGFTDSWLDNY